ncbi:MAG TPA: hypothetical protein VGF25_16805 [Thermoleophilaceae bacterium]|jgi:hypothetical protein
MKRGFAVAGAIAVLAVAGVSAGQAATEHSHGHGMGAHKATKLAFHDDMRKLWEDHITWTRLAIVSFAAGLPDFDQTAGRLLQNQVDIGNAIKPYYGRKAGNQLTALLREHILGAVEVLKAAKAGDNAAFATAKRAWYANGREIARFLNRASPRFLPLAATQRMMRGHLDQTLDEAAHRLSGDFAADIRDYERIHHHILMMADAISGAIIKQFPSRFR